MKPSFNIGLFLFNAIMIPLLSTFGTPTPVWLAILQVAALILTALSIGGDAYFAGQEEAEGRCRTDANHAYNRGFEAGIAHANNEVRKAVDGWFNV